MEVKEGDTDESIVPPVSDSPPENKTSEEDEEGVECGFLVDRICTQPYRKAMDRGEIPFCAFAPISTQEMFLLRIQDCSDTTRHMLVPASKEDVFNTPGALKAMDDDQEPGNEDSINYTVAIVAIARQIYSDEDKRLVVSVDPPLKKDKKRIQLVKFLTVDKFADFAFLGFDGNVSEFANNNSTSNESTNKENRNAASTVSTQSHKSQLQTADEPNPLSTPAIPISIKSPPKAPARRGRGGRRRLNRKSPSGASPKLPIVHQMQQPQHSVSQFFPNNFQPLPGVALSHDLPNDFAEALIKLEQNDRETQQFLTQSYQIPVPQVSIPVDQSLYAQETFVVPTDMSMAMMQVPTPVSEVTISTTEPGADVGAQQTNHDLITIAFDQLVGMSSEVTSSDASVSEKSSRGGRRSGPGRKPGRKPKDRHPNQIDIMDDSMTFGHTIGTGDEAPVMPKRRGRPPKNRIQVPTILPCIENENSNSAMDVEMRDDLENYEKRLKMHLME